MRGSLKKLLSFFFKPEFDNKCLNHLLGKCSRNHVTVPTTLGQLFLMVINKPQVKMVVEKVGGAYGRDST